MKVSKNKAEGAAFEHIFSIQARLNGLFCEKNNLSAKFIPGRRTLIIKSELDYKLIDRSGCVGFFDCKSYAKEFFNFSDIDKNQLLRAIRYNDWNVPSGFVVWFRAINKVVSFSGHLIQGYGPGHKFLYDHGRSIGSIEGFNLKDILKKNTGFPDLPPPILQLST